MSLHKHQHQCLVAELRKPEYAGMNAEQVAGKWRKEAVVRAMEKAATDGGITNVSNLEYVLSTRPDYIPAPKSLSVSFVAAKRFAQFSTKQQANMQDFSHRGSANVIVLDDSYAAQFPTGIPGMPNVIRPEDLGAAIAAR